MTTFTSIEKQEWYTLIDPRIQLHPADGSPLYDTPMNGEWYEDENGAEYVLWCTEDGNIYVGTRHGGTLHTLEAFSVFVWDIANQRQRQRENRARKANDLFKYREMAIIEAYIDDARNDFVEHSRWLLDRDIITQDDRRVALSALEVIRHKVDAQMHKLIAPLTDAPAAASSTGDTDRPTDEQSA